MRLKSLRLFEFRNVERLEIELAERVNFFVGDNGQGKTNLLEAVYVMGRGVSFRPSQSQSFQRHGPHEIAPRAKASGVFAGEHFDETIDVLFESGRRSATLNGKRATTADLVRAVPVVLFSPESLAAIKEGPDQRRALADDLVLTQAPRQAKLLAEYAKCLKARNRLLRDIARARHGQDGAGADLRGLEFTLESLDKIYFLLCTHLTEARVEALRAILPDLQDAMAFISDVSPGDISVDYLISDRSALAWDEAQIFEALRNRHADLARQELNSGVSLVGPHKHDVRFLFRENDSRFYCSQGQQRALILSFKIAQIVYHHRVHQTYPILLLDDVMSELDAKKRIGLMKFLGGISAQILMTATDLTWPEQFGQTGSGGDKWPAGAGRNAIFTVTEGRVAPQATAL